jgi:uncharacterized protein YrrD
VPVTIPTVGIRGMGRLRLRGRDGAAGTFDAVHTDSEHTPGGIMRTRIMKELRGSDIVASDGSLGSVRDAYFDDERWTVRYLVVDTGNWLPGRQVLLSPASISAIAQGSVRVALSRKQVEEAPGVEEHKPVSRLYEESHALYYGYPYYWGGPYLWGPVAMPGVETMLRQGPHAAQSGGLEEAREQAESEARTSHLRSAGEVVGYQIQATDGSIGHVEDFVVDDATWAIAEMLVDTRNWLPGKKVRVRPDAIAEVEWATREVRVRMTRAEIENAAEA